jgi:Phage integrase family
MPAPSPHTWRNTFNNLRWLFRTAQHYHIITPLAGLPRTGGRNAMVRQRKLTSPYRPRRLGVPYGLPTSAWPPNVRTTWEHYRAAKGLYVRTVTLENYESYLSLYLGFLVHIEGVQVHAWADLFDLTYLDRFVRWHSQRVNAGRLSRLARHCAELIRALAIYHCRPEADAIRTYVRHLPTPTAMHDKQAPLHTFTLLEIEQIGLGLLEDAYKALDTPRPGIRRPGLSRALRHQRALMFRLLVRIPLRARNICEMQITRNLFEDDQGAWHIRFQDDELKVRERHGKINDYYATIPSDLNAHLEEFRVKYRPQLPNADRDPHVFLTQSGRPFNQNILREEIAGAAYQRTGKHLYPHLIRTIWSDTMLLRGMDVSTVAYWLNNDPTMIYRRYHELRARVHIPIVHAALQAVLQELTPQVGNGLSSLSNHKLDPLHHLSLPPLTRGGT